MVRTSLFWKIFGASLALIGLTALGAGWMAARQVSEDVRRDTRRHLRAQVDLLAGQVLDSFSPHHDAALQGRMRDLAQRTGMRITLVRADGTVLADSDKDPRGMDDHGQRPEVLAARTQDFGEAERYSDTLGADMLYVARAVPRPDAPVGFVRGALSYGLIEEREARLRGTILGTSGVAVLVGLLAALFLARRLTRPIRAVAEAAGAIAQGDLDRRVPITTKDEISDLGRQFNEMAHRLEQEVTTIRSDQRETRAILGGMVEGVLAVDREERIVLVNEAGARILGVDPLRAAGTRLWESVRVPQIAETLAAAISARAVRTALARITGEGAAERTVHVHASPLVGDDGDLAGAVIVLHDVTERERVEAMRRDFVANASHELKTPIASVRGLVETVLDDPEMDAGTRQEFLGRVLRQADRLGTLVQEMLLLSRLDAPGTGIEVTPLDACAVVRAVVEELEGLARERRTELACELPEGEVIVLGEAEALHRIVGNLLENAIKYTQEGGHVRAALSVDAAGAVVEISDDGPGIPADQQARIFERFYRVDEGRSREMGGTGLGLAIVKHLVSALGGRIDLESSSEAGSAFRVRLPRA